MEDLMKAQYQTIGAINNELTNFKKDGPSRWTEDNIKRRLDVLDSLWQKFEANHHLLLTGYEDKSHHYFVENQYEQTQVFYNNVRTYIIHQSSNPVGQRPATPVLKPAVLKINPAPTFSKQAGGTQTSESNVNKATPSKTEDLLRKQSSNFKAFYRTATNINVDLINEKWEFQDNLNTLQARWSAIDSLHWEIDSELNGANKEYEEEFNKYENHYNQIKTALNKKLWSVSHKEKSTPQMDIPVFSGNLQNWTSFKDLFIETIHSNPSLSSAQKMQFLKSKIRGEAERLVQHLAISSDNYQKCWELLNHRFNNKRSLFTSYINTLLNLPTMQHQTSVQIKRIHDTTNECLHAIQNLGVDISTWDPILVHLLAQKLDADTNSEYVKSMKNVRELPQLSEFLNFLEEKFVQLDTSRRKQEQKPSSQPQNQDSASGSKKFHSYKAYSTNHKQQKPLKHFGKTSNFIATKCPHCNGDHGLFSCKLFLELDAEAKRKAIAKYNLCKNCLYNHNGKDCISEKRCRQCNEKHNTILHDAYANLQPSTFTYRHGGGANSNLKATASNNNHVSRESIPEILLSTALLYVQSSDGSPTMLRALIDQGSQTSLITENAAQRLGIPRKRCNGVIFGVGAKENNCKGVIKISCTAINSDYTFDTDVYIMRNLINNLPNRSFKKPTWPYLESIELADPDFNISRPVDLLLGADIYSNIMMEGIIKTEKTQPIAQQTRLGWILCGNVQTFQCNVVINNMEDIYRFWNIEDITVENSKWSEEDLQCIKYYQETTKRSEDGRYVVNMPMKENFEENLGKSKPTAMAQYRQLEKKFLKQEKLAEKYREFINEYKGLNHMVESTSNSTPSCYLPHHCVLRPDSATTALRVVFNASSRTSTGYTLNDLMKCGPNLQQDLMYLILRWRQYKYAFIADIEKMFRQIWINPEHQKLLKILWRDSPDQLLREYQLTTVTYGTKAAPFLAMMTLKQLSIDEGHHYPDSPASQALQEDMYMDDLQTGAFSLEQAKKLKSDLINLLKSGGFNLRKWRSNCKELESINETTNKEAFEYKQPESTKTLGLRWLPESDEFTFKLQIDTAATEKWTKRSLLSDISKLFDPIGWYSPLTVKMKLLFKKVWLANIQWDDELPDDISKEWLKIKMDLENINEIKIPRWYQSRENDTIELHGFCDASTKAYASVVYSKTYDENQTPRITLVAAKTRLAPENKNLTLPRLELSGAYLLSDLMRKVYQALSRHNITMYGWTDSTAVLGWMQGDANKWKTFVANRVAHIQEVMPPQCWHYVKSEENPADCASRGILPHQLREHPLWWHGPDFLKSKYQEEKDQPVYDTNMELKNTKQTNVATQTCDVNSSIILQVICKQSSFTRAIRVLAWILRIITRYNKQTSHLTSEEMKRSRELIIKTIQQVEFSEEIRRLKEGEELSSKSKILSLRPFLDKEGLLRVGGRIRHANIDENMKHPLIIPSSSHLTSLIIEHAHNTTYHGGARITLSKIRKQYWIIGGTRVIKDHIRRCVTCRKWNPIKQNQLMGDLPEARVNQTRPFYHTGVDYTGYVDIKMNKGRGAKTTKGYVAVFICMVTKAVHLELVSDLSTSAFLAALRRMSARRGKPRHMHSDCGTNFVGSNRVLQEACLDLKQIQTDEFFAELEEMEIEWHFNCPSWPSAGGLWEAAVKSLKHHLKRVVGEQKLTFEEYTTLLTQLEACLNSRPLCALTEDPDDLDYLTPSHFLASGPILSIVETETDERTRWQMTQKIYQDIWKRWKTEYLTQLSARSKWQASRPNIQIDDVVLIHDANLPAGRWALGRVMELHPGKDGLVRVVTLKTKNGFIKRPVIKLSVLPTKSESTENRESKQTSNQDDSIKKDQNKAEPLQTRPIRTCRQKKGTLASMVITFLFFMTMTTTSLASYNITNITKAMYFDRMANMQLIRDEWKLVVYYDMDPYWSAIEALEKYTSYLGNICSKAQRKTHCDVILSQLRHSRAELEYDNHVLLGQQSLARARRRRGLINGVGSIANSLFGILDDNFAIQYQKDIDLIRKNQKHLANLWKNQTSVVEAEYNLLKRTEENINKQHKIINQHFIELEKAQNRMTIEVQDIELLNEFAISSIITNTMLANLKTIQDTLLDIITDIHHGKFDFHLLRPQQLQEELNIISGQLSQDLSLPIQNIQTDLSQIYHLLGVKARITHEYLIIELKIPLISRESFDLYRVFSVPRKHEESMVTLTPVTTHVAINLRKDTFVTMTYTDVQQCLQSSSTYYCHSQHPIYQLKADDDLCIKETKTNKCQMNIFACKNKWTELSQTNTYLYFCCNECRLRVMCEDQVTVAELSGAGVIVLSPDCIIKGEDFSVFTRKQQTSKIRSEANVYTPEISPINKIFNVSVPLINISSTITDHQQSLEKISRQIEEMKTETPLSDGLSYHDVHHYMAIYLLLAGLASAAALYVWRRRAARVAPHPETGPASTSSDQTNGQMLDLRVLNVTDKSTSPMPREKLFVTSAC